MNVNILYEDKDVIVCVKPAGMPSQAERSSSMDMVSWLKNYLSKKQGDARCGVPYVSVVHRLDRPVGGVMVYAKTKKAADDPLLFGNRSINGIAETVGQRQWEVQNGIVVEFFQRIGWIHGETPFCLTHDRGTDSDTYTIA